MHRKIKASIEIKSATNLILPLTQVEKFVVEQSDTFMKCDQNGNMHHYCYAVQYRQSLDDSKIKFNDPRIQEYASFALNESPKKMLKLFASVTAPKHARLIVNDPPTTIQSETIIYPRFTTAFANNWNDIRDDLFSNRDTSPDGGDKLLYVAWMTSENLPSVKQCLGNNYWELVEEHRRGHVTFLGIKWNFKHKLINKLFSCTFILQFEHFEHY